MEPGVHAFLLRRAMDAEIAYQTSRMRSLPNMGKPPAPFSPLAPVRSSLLREGLRKLAGAEGLEQGLTSPMLPTSKHTLSVHQMKIIQDLQRILTAISMYANKRDGNIRPLGIIIGQTGYAYISKLEDAIKNFFQTFALRNRTSAYASLNAIYCVFLDAENLLADIDLRKFQLEESEKIIRISANLPSASKLQRLGHTINVILSRVISYGNAHQGAIDALYIPKLKQAGTSPFFADPGSLLEYLSEVNTRLERLGRSGKYALLTNLRISLRGAEKGLEVSLGCQLPLLNFGTEVQLTNFELAKIKTINSLLSYVQTYANNNKGNIAALEIERPRTSRRKHYFQAVDELSKYVANLKKNFASDSQRTRDLILETLHNRLFPVEEFIQTGGDN